MDIPILYTDADVLVVNKPSGLVVNRADSVKKETVQDWVEQNSEFRIQSSELENADFCNRSGIVHRLDKDTSGCLIIAKNEPSFVHLQQQFKDRTIQKEYCALVHGEVKPHFGTINAPIGRLPWKRMRFGVTTTGRAAETKYQVEKVLENNAHQIYSLLVITPATGRTHQIRAHLKHIGHTIVCDPWYAGRKELRSDKKWCVRLFLHAAKISFIHPRSKKTIVVDAKLSDDLKIALSTLVQA